MSPKGVWYQAGPKDNEIEKTKKRAIIISHAIRTDLINEKKKRERERKRLFIVPQNTIQYDTARFKASDTQRSLKKGMILEVRV